MTEDEWGEPSQTGDQLLPRDIVNHLLIIWVVEYVPHSPTVHTRPDRPSDMIVVDVVNLDHADERGYQGLLHRNVWWRQARLIARLRDRIGQRLLCRMTQGTARPGFNAPFELINVKDDPEARSRGDAWIKAHPDFVPSEPITGSRYVSSPPATTQTNSNANSWNSAAPAQPQAQNKTYLERLAEQAAAGASRLPLPPPPPAATETPPF